MRETFLVADAGSPSLSFLQISSFIDLSVHPYSVRRENARGDYLSEGDLLRYDVFAFLTISRRLADRKVAKFQKNIARRGSVPETTVKKGNDYPVGPIVEEDDFRRRDSEILSLPPKSSLCYEVVRQLDQVRLEAEVAQTTVVQVKNLDKLIRTRERVTYVKLLIKVDMEGMHIDKVSITLPMGAYTRGHKTAHTGRSAIEITWMVERSGCARAEQDTTDWETPWAKGFSAWSRGQSEAGAEQNKVENGYRSLSPSKLGQRAELVHRRAEPTTVQRAKPMVNGMQTKKMTCRSRPMKQ
ncbi:hypothetical protein ZIOFF_031003 [Zingiber officinale]|uniref:Uncharacterized protein n=1 Tax=Zingiber officinale TaxID=94328 RepID=A0A8J5H5S9_ZINOF|nr:hypothetical protein ZIOFF_031003 [Zingiber officinale]